MAEEVATIGTEQSRPELCGRAGLARILEVSESTARHLERRGLIRPVMRVGKRALFAVQDAQTLRGQLRTQAAAA